MKNSFLLWAAIFGMLNVVLGAFSAHMLQSMLTPEQLHSYETGVRYQMYHALALLVVGILLVSWPTSSYLRSAGRLFIIGVLLFSGSIYLLNLRHLLGLDGIQKFIGPITPIGDLLLIGGWLSLAWAVISARKA
jgi:uncharacterized membrane protein YgdD (TMEM256/DUF423 family)